MLVLLLSIIIVRRFPGVMPRTMSKIKTIGVRTPRCDVGVREDLEIRRTCASVWSEAKYYYYHYDYNSSYYYDIITILLD